jgi:hypothetical protein
LASLLKFPRRLHPFASAPRPVLPIGLGQFRLVSIQFLLLYQRQESGQS